MTSPFEHTTVLLAETMSLLSPRAGGVYADATLGGGGHAEAILEASAPDGRLLGLDRDAAALTAARARLSGYGDRAVFVHGEFSSLPAILSELEFGLLDGLVADLGVSSHQLDTGERGFSFSKDGPLDMRMDQSSGTSARDLVRQLSENELADIIYSFGEERRSRSIARSIKRAIEDGEMETTTDLRRAVVRVTGPKRTRTDPSTKTFQALRIAVNHELDELQALLAFLPDVLADDGVGAIISFHSAEDRLVKRAFRGDDRLLPLTKRPIVPGETEESDNRRSRSAKLRAARRLSRERMGGDA